MYWTVVLEAAPTTDLPYPDPALENVERALAFMPGVLGAVVFGGVHDRTIGARFDVQAADAAEAVNAGVGAFLGALSVNGFVKDTVAITRVEAELDAEDVPVADAHALTVA